MRLVRGGADTPASSLNLSQGNGYEEDDVEMPEYLGEQRYVEGERIERISLSSGSPPASSRTASPVPEQSGTCNYPFCTYENDTPPLKLRKCTLCTDGCYFHHLCAIAHGADGEGDDGMCFTCLTAAADEVRGRQSSHRVSVLPQPRPICHVPRLPLTCMPAATLAGARGWRGG